MADRADRVCTVCGKEFRYPWMLKRHTAGKKSQCTSAIGRASAAPNVTCGGCGKIFSAPTNRARHERLNCPKRNDVQETPSELEELKRQVARLTESLAVLAANQNQQTMLAPISQPSDTQSHQTVAIQNQQVNVDVQQNINVVNQTYVTIQVGELEKADLGALQTLAGRIEDESREGDEAAWLYVVEGARALHGGAAGGLLVPNKKEGRVLRVRGGKWAEEAAPVALEAPSERLVWELVRGANHGLMGIFWKDLEAREGPYLRLDRGLKKLITERKEELIGKGGPLFAVGVENAADWRREGKKMPKPGEEAVLLVAAPVAAIVASGGPPEMMPH